MTEMRDILNLLDEDMQVEDTFDLELSEDLVIETGVIGLTEDAVIIEADDETLDLLEASGITLDEGDVIQGPWGNTPPAASAPVVDKPKAPVIPINQPTQPPAKFRIQDLYREFKNSPQVRQKMKAVLQGSLPLDQKDDEVMNMAAQYLEAKLGKVHPKLLGKYALAFLDLHKAENSAQEMRETDGLDEIARLAGVQMVGGKTPAELERMANVPTAQRIATGETPPVDRTDYNVPPGQRTSTAGMTGPEIRRQSLIKQGIIQAEGEEVEEGMFDRFKSANKYYTGDTLDINGVKVTLHTLGDSVPGSNKPVQDAGYYAAWLGKDGKQRVAQTQAHKDLNSLKKELLGLVTDTSGKYIANPNIAKRFKVAGGYPSGQFGNIEEKISEEEVEESGLQAYLGKKKYGKKGMEALQQAGREGASKEKMAQLRAKYDKLDEKMKMGADSDASAAGSYMLGEGPADAPEHEDTDADDKRWDDKEESVDEAKYQGREVPLGKPMAGDVKKSKVYVRKPDGKVVKVNFGDKNMKIKKSNPKRRKSFRARHNCKNPGPRWKARYWSCRAW